MDTDAEPNLVHANFFFVDAVGASNPTLSTKLQLKKIKVLNDSIKNCKTFQNAKDSLFSIPAGDGMCIGFQEIDMPLKLAIELNKKIAEYNKGKVPSETVQLRIGLNDGHCFFFSDAFEKKQVWGNGIVIAKRIMDLGDDGHILLSQNMAEELIELSDEYRKTVKPVRDYPFKHGLSMLVYSTYGDGFGNKNPPQRPEIQKSILPQELAKLQNSMLYQKISVEINIQDPVSMLVHHKRSCEIANISNEPIKYILHGIATDVEKESINDLDLKIYDNSNQEMKISSISYDSLFSKEFSTIFPNPIMPNQTGSGYTLEYHTEEPKKLYDNSFLVDCKEFNLAFSFPSESIFDPQLYEINPENDQKAKSTVLPSKSESEKSTILSWKINDVLKGQNFRLEW